MIWKAAITMTPKTQKKVLLVLCWCELYGLLDDAKMTHGLWSQNIHLITGKLRVYPGKNARGGEYDKHEKRCINSDENDAVRPLEMTPEEDEIRGGEE